MPENTHPSFNTSKYAIGDLIRIASDPGSVGWASRVTLWATPVESSRISNDDAILRSIDGDEVFAIVLCKTHVSCKVVTSKGHVGWLDAYDIWKV
jgi:hypothetical protein